MRWIKWIGFLGGVLLLVSCFMVWAELPARNISISGVSAEGTSFGKPGYFHLVLGSLFLVLHFIPKIWSKRTNLIVVAINLAWAVRNYFIITICRRGECPEKHIGIYLVLITSIILLVAALLPDIKLPGETQQPDTKKDEGATP